jgi:putative Holliday junction resolvase
VRILALDHGAARVGCAICDPSETLARPLGVITPDPAEVARTVREHEAELVVVGLPVSLSGDEGEQARVARRFAEELAGVLDVPVETYDERLTTRMADSTRRSGASAPQDALAAAHLLESFLDHRAAQRSRR